jgi:hypothetical protein
LLNGCASVAGPEGLQLEDQILESHGSMAQRRERARSIATGFPAAAGPL